MSAADWKTNPGDFIADLEQAAEAMRNQRFEPFVHFVSPARYRWLCAWHERILRENAERAEFERRIRWMPGALALARVPFFWRLWWRWQAFRNRRMR